MLIDVPTWRRIKRRCGFPLRIVIGSGANLVDVTRECRTLDTRTGEAVLYRRDPSNGRFYVVDGEVATEVRLPARVVDAAGETVDPEAFVE